MLASYQETGGGQNFTFTYTYNLTCQLLTETNPQGRTMTTTYDITGRPTKLTGSLSGNGTTYVSSQTYGYFGLPFSYTRGNNVTHAQSYNIRLQPMESYEAVGNSGNSLLFISCPNWGVNANWNVFDQCPHANSSNDNGTVQSYQEL